MASKKVVLKSSDGESFEVDEAVARHSPTIAGMLDDGRSPVPLSNVTSEILAKVIDYCKKHVEAVDEELMTWDTDFMKIDQSMLFKLMRAAHFLQIKKLVDLTCITVADMMKGKTSEQIRETFNIKNDLTPEEEAAIRKENQWAFE